MARDPIQDVIFRPETREEIEWNAYQRGYDIAMWVAGHADRLQAELEGALAIAKTYADALEEALIQLKQQA